jgi:8-oxo-dGTP pyrophosphatase MutT (NUDIX family)
VSGFRIVGSRTLSDVGFLSLTEEQVEGPERELFTRYAVHHPGAIVVVPIDVDGVSAVLVRQFRAAIGRELLEVPAGKRDVRGEAPEDTARRELEEEIGRRPGRLVELCEFHNSPGFCDEYTHLFVALDLETVEAPRPVSAEERALTVVPVPLADVDRLIASRELVDAKSIIGLLLARRYLAGEYGGVLR